MRAEQISVFMENRAGRLAEVSIELGDAEAALGLCRRALAAVEGSAPLPPPPSRFGDAGVEINFRFSYSR